jgi:hypothetical protein
LELLKQEVIWARRFPFPKNLRAQIVVENVRAQIHLSES